MGVSRNVEDLCRYQCRLRGRGGRIAWKFIPLTPALSPAKPGAREEIFVSVRCSVRWLRGTEVASRTEANYRLNFRKNLEIEVSVCPDENRSRKRKRRVRNGWTATSPTKFHNDVSQRIMPFQGSFAYASGSCFPKEVKVLRSFQDHTMVGEFVPTVSLRSTAS